MMWLKKARRQSDGGIRKPYCYHIDQFESLRPVYMRVIDYCRQMGLDMIQGDHEDAPASSSSTSPMTTRCAPPTGSPPIARSAPRWRASSTSSPASCASRSWASRPMAATTTSRCGRAARTSSSRSATIRRTCPGSKQNYMYRRGGENTFMPDTGDVQLPGKTGLWASAASSSISAALPRSAARRSIPTAACGTPASGRRCLPTGASRTAPRGLRVSAPGRFEYRAVDSMVNPYLMAAGLLKAMRRRPQAQARPRQARGAQHLPGDGGRQAGQEAADDARRRARGAEERRGDQARRCRARCTAFTTSTSATNGNASSHTVDRMGPEDAISTACREPSRERDQCAESPD